MTEIEKLIRALQRATKNLEAVSLETPEVPDAAGAVRAVEVRLGDMRRAWNDAAVADASDPESEYGPDTLGSQEPEKGPYGGTIHPKVTGTKYRTVTTRSCKRTYNTAAIMVGLARADELPEVTDPVEALMWAIENKVATVKWGWRQLEKMAKGLGLPMRVVPREIADDGDIEAPWVGEDWKDKTTQEPITS